MTITILPYLVDAHGANPLPHGDPIRRQWPGDCGPICGDRIPPCVDGLGVLTVRGRQWVPAGASVELQVTAWGRAAEVGP